MIDFFFSPNDLNILYCFQLLVLDYTIYLNNLLGFFFTYLIIIIFMLLVLDMTNNKGTSLLHEMTPIKEQRK